MKTETRVREHESNLSGERVGMTIDTSALAHIMGVLTDLYSDPEMAVIREYSTNALDAHVDAGESRPIEVTLPSALSPFFKVRDYGEGLDSADIRDVFSKYGASTKRESNDVVGMLGLGCKSALTYTDQFTLTGTKGGLTTQVLVSRDEDGSGSMTVVSENVRDGRENGTEITVPAKRTNAFASKAAGFFRFWKPGTVHVNGVKPERIDGLWLTDSLLLTPNVDADTVVMGNVPYPFLSDVQAPIFGRSSYGHNRRHIVAFVPIGSVLFTPSREALQSTKKTREALAGIIEETKAKRDAAIVAQVAAAPTPAAAVALLREGRDVGFEGEAKYQGRPVPLRLDRTPREANGNTRPTYLDSMTTEQLAEITFLHGGDRYNKVKGERTFTADFDGAPRLWFEGFTSKEMSPTKRDKLAEWLRRKNLDARPFTMVDRLTPTERFWLQGATVYAWTEVEEIKLPKDAPAGADPHSRPRGAYDGVKPGGRIDRPEHFAADTIDTSRPIFYYHGRKYDLPHLSHIKVGAVSVEGATVVCLPAGRIEKFRRDFPTAKSLEQAAREAAEGWKAGLSKEDVRAWAYQYQRAHGADRLRGLNPERVNDPALRKAIRLASRDVSAVKDGLRKFGPWVSIEGDGAANVLRAYPLVADGYSRINAEHFYLYVNAAYDAAGKDGNDAS